MTQEESTWAEEELKGRAAGPAGRLGATDPIFASDRGLHFEAIRNAILRLLPEGQPAPLGALAGQIEGLPADQRLKQFEAIRDAILKFAARNTEHTA